MLTYCLPIINSHFSQREMSLLPFVSQERRAVIERFRFDESKVLSLYCALLLRHMICTYTGIKNNELVFDISKHGKPYLKGYENIDFNISHTKGMAFCAVSDTSKVGVDTEHIRPIKYNIMKTCFHPKEIEYVEQFGDDEHFFEVWTKKEAYTKYLGTGLTTDITSINVFLKEHDEHLVSFIKDNYIFSVYSDEPQKVQPLNINIDELIHSFMI